MTNRIRTGWKIRIVRQHQIYKRTKEIEMNQKLWSSLNFLATKHIYVLTKSNTKNQCNNKSGIIMLEMAGLFVAHNFYYIE